METKEINVGKELSDWIKEKTINQFLELKSEYKNLSDAGKGAYIVTEDFCKKKGHVLSINALLSASARIPALPNALSKPEP